MSFDVSNPNPTPVLLTTISAAFQTTTNPMGSIRARRLHWWGQRLRRRDQLGHRHLAGNPVLVDSGWFDQPEQRCRQKTLVACWLLLAQCTSHAAQAGRSTGHSTPTSTGINQNACNGAPLTL